MSHILSLKNLDVNFFAFLAQKIQKLLAPLAI